MKRYIITNTILSRAEGATPVDVTWYRGEDKPQAMAALLSAMNHGDDSADSNLPESMKFDIIETRIETVTIPDPDVLGYRVDWPEDHDFGLDSCCWWDNQYQPWARLDCTGRMAVVTMTRNGHDQTAAIMCEGHVNAYPDGNTL